MLEFVKKLIDKKTNYLKDFDLLLKDYNEENEIVKGYNGRQILELLQNCDDESSTEVLIKLNKEAKTITISNNGTPFSQKGYRSLFFSYLSSKTSKRKYIGNKGLGFRSIINWSNQIEIQSNNLSLIYNQENRTHFFQANFNKETREKILNEENFIETAIPVPFLGVPQIKEIGETAYVTSIIITYNEEFLENIFEQVKSITPETLFFLHSLEKIKFDGFGEEMESIETIKESINKKSRTFKPTEKITLKDKKWFIFEEEDFLDEVIVSDKKEKEFYQIKIAIEENMSKTVSSLYSFFPTNIKLEQPYILHATFELDATRKQLVDSKKNKIILEKVALFTTKVAKYFANNKVNYKPLEILNHNHIADTLDNLGYYDLIEKAYLQEAIFPCIDNSYRKLEEVIYVSDNFAKMLKIVNASNLVGYHLIAAENVNLSKFNFFSKLDKSISYIGDLVDTFNSIAASNLTIAQRTLFIYEVVKNGNYLKTNFKNQLNLLIDKDDKIILGSEYIYTPVTRDNELKTPAFAKIKFINKELYEALSNTFNFNPEQNKVKSRFVSEELEGFSNINSYEPANLIQKIISETKKEFLVPECDEIKIIQEMNACLFYNFQFVNANSTKASLPKEIPCISKSLILKNTNELILSNEYPDGKLNNFIFEDILSINNYVADPTKLGLNISNEEDIHKIQSFINWLGINKIAIYSNNHFNGYGADDYFNYVYNYDTHGPRTGYIISYTSIKGFTHILNKISLEKLILWIHLDYNLKSQLYDDRNSDSFYYFYRTSRPIWHKPSYLKYLINIHYKIKFDNLLFDDNYSWVNDLEINYNDPIFIENNISKSAINEILVALGAKDNFNALPIDIVADIINKLVAKYPDGNKSSTFYKKALGHYKVNQEIIKKPLQLFADDGESKKPFNQNQIYFSDKIKLPKRLKKDFPVFNFPARQGGADAIKFFGINDLNDVKITLKNFEKDEPLSERLNAHLKQLKPYILTLRISSIDDVKQQRIQASICNNIKLELCTELEYSVNESSYKALNYEYLHHSEQTYYLKINENDKIEELIENTDFTDAIVEIIELSFDVKSEKSEFRNIFRNKIELVKNDIIKDFGIDTLNEAYNLLGLSNFKQAFWKTILNLKGIVYEESLDDLALTALLLEKFNVTFEVSSLDYELISSPNQIIKLENLFDDLQISLEDFAQEYPYTIDFTKQHSKTLKNTILSNKPKVKSAIWKKLKQKGVQEQKEFLVEIDKFEDCEEFVNKTAKTYKNTFQIEDKEKELDRFISLIYGDLILDEIIVFESILQNNKKKFSKEELSLINEDLELKSLLYFEDALSELKNRLKSRIEENAETTNNIIDAFKDTISNEKELKMVSSKILKKKTKKSINAGKKKPFLPKSENKEKLKNTGETSEKRVMKYLNDNGFKNVYKASDDNEGLHYDIRFSDENGTIKYIEVKTFNNGMFHLSKDQFEFGKENQEDFEIWLVLNNEEIIPIKDFYTNAKYNPIASEYEVYLDLEKD